MSKISTLAQIGSDIAHNCTRVIDMNPHALLDLQREVQDQRLDITMAEAMDRLEDVLAHGPSVHAMHRVLENYVQAVYRGIAAKHLSLVGPAQVRAWEEVFARLPRACRLAAPLLRHNARVYVCTHVLANLEEEFERYFPFVPDASGGESEVAR